MTFCDLIEACMNLSINGVDMDTEVNIVQSNGKCFKIESVAMASRNDMYWTSAFPGIGDKIVAININEDLE